MKISLIYTSDVHGQLTASDYAHHGKGPFGLTRLPVLLNNLQHPTILLDNGDFLQGNVLLDYHREHTHNEPHPLVTTYNQLGYRIVNLGNHDFNYGIDYLKSVVNQLDATILCANAVDTEGIPLFEPYSFIDTKGFVLGIIGVVTHYIPNWEKPAHIQGITFLDAYETVKRYLPTVRQKADYVIVMYHGGFERRLDSGEPIGRDTSENQGYKMAELDGIDLLLTGHQHMPTCHLFNHRTWVLQTAANAMNAGLVTLEGDLDNGSLDLTHDATLVPLDGLEDNTLNRKLSDLENRTQQWLDRHIGTTPMSMSIEDPCAARRDKHPLFEWINRMQLTLTGAMLSVASLPNNAPGFKQTIQLRDIAANFVFPNTLSVLEITGKQLKEALERSAEYFTISENIVSVDSSFLYPKAEHYNYDVYDGIEYTFDLNRDKGHRVTRLVYQGVPVKDDHTFTLVLNNYRAGGGGDYPMFKEATWLKDYDTSLFDLAVKTIAQDPIIDFERTKNFTLIV